MNNSANIISTLAFADSVHDFDRAAKSLMSLIVENLPGFVHTILNEESSIEYAETTSGNKFTPITSTMANTIFRQLGGTSTRPIGIVCDASFCSNFVKTLCTNTIGKVYIIKNREGKNDQGPNPSFRGISVNYAYETDIDLNIAYPKFEDNDTIVNKFGSVFTLELSDTELYCYSNGEYHDQATFSQNTRISILDDIHIFHTILNDVMINRDIKAIHDVQFRFIQKRSGDFLQVLSCADKDRVYDIDGEEKNLRDMTVYFCSADRIPCAYALSVGINTIYISGKGNKVFRNMSDLPDHIDAEFQKLLDDKNTVKRNLEWMLNTYIRISNLLKERINTVHLAETVEDIKKYIGYAYQFDCLPGSFGSIYKDAELVHTFIEDDTNPIFSTNLTKRKLLSHVFHYKSAKKYYWSFDIETPLHDKIYREFNPLIYKRIYQEHELSNKKTTEEKYVNPYGALYGMALLSTLFHNPELKEFVNICVHKILDLAEIAGVPEAGNFYKFFLERHRNHHSGGSYNSEYSLIRDAYREMAEICMDYLNDKSGINIFHMRRLRICEFRTRTTSFLDEIFNLLYYVTLKKNIEIPRFADYIERMVTPEKRSDREIAILRKYRPFLKIKNNFRNQTLKKILTVKARKRTRKHYSFCK